MAKEPSHPLDYAPRQQFDYDPLAPIPPSIAWPLCILGIAFLIFWGVAVWCANKYGT